MNKYRARKTEYNGVKYDSQLEARVAMMLDQEQRAGEILGYKRQVKIPLEAYGKKICDYVIDFVVFHRDGPDDVKNEYLEVKGMITRDWRIKWKMFSAKAAVEEPDAILTIFRGKKEDTRFIVGRPIDKRVAVSGDTLPF